MPEPSPLEALAAAAMSAALVRHGLSVHDGPDDDAWDLDFEEETFPLAVHIAYTATDGARSQRRVTIRKIWRTDGALYFRGRCDTRKADRTFRADRVQVLTCLATGEVPDDIEAWLLDLTSAPSLRPDPTAAAIHALHDELEVLAYLARVDELHPAELEVIVDFVASKGGTMCDRAALARYVRKLTPTYYGLAPIVRRLAADAQRWRDLRACVVAVLKADGDVTADELAAWTELAETAKHPSPTVAAIALETVVVERWELATAGPSAPPERAGWAARLLSAFSTATPRADGGPG